MNKYIMFSCCILIVIAVAYGGINNKPHIPGTGNNGNVNCCNAEYPTIKALVLDDYIEYDYKMTNKDQALLQEKVLKLSKCLKKENVIPIDDWYVEETLEHLYFFSRDSFIPENKNTTVIIKKHICKSHVCGSRYTSGIEFNNNGRDPVIKKGRTYFSGIELGFIVKVYKGAKNDGRYAIYGPTAYIKKGKLLETNSPQIGFFEWG